jgi:hypothetical protein
MCVIKINRSVTVWALTGAILTTGLAGISAEDKKGGNISFVEKEVKRKPLDASWTDAKNGDEVQTGHKVKTLIDSRAELNLQGLSVIRLAPQTTINIEKLYEENKSDGKQESSIGLEGGDLWASVDKLDESTKFNINTKVAGTAIRGTTLRMTTDSAGETDVKVYKGEVAVTSSSGNPNGKPQDIKEEVSGPQEVAGPEEVSMEDWTYIVKEMQKIHISKQGEVLWAKKFKKDDKDEQTDWVKWNEKRDAQTKKGK